MEIFTKQRFGYKPRPKRHAQTVRLEDLEQALATGKPGASVVISRTDRECRYTYISSGVEQITGVPAAAFIGKSLPIRGIDPQAAAQLAKARADVYHAMKPSHIEIAYPTSSGMRYFWTAIIPEYDEQEHVQSSLALSIDITAQKQLTGGSTHLQLEMALDLARMAVWDWDLSGDRKLWSARFAQLFGFGANDNWHLNRDWVDRIHPEDRQAVLACLHYAVRGQGTFESEYRIIVPGLGIRCLHALGKVTNRGADEPTRFIGVVRDITDTKTVDSLEGRDTREFVPAFTFHDRIFAWRCNVCDKLFMRTSEDAEGATTSSRLMNEFHSHHCAANIQNQPPL